MYNSVVIDWFQVPPSAIYLTQNLSLVRKFETRPTSEYRLRFDASSIMVSPDGNLVVTDRQLDRVSIYSSQGKAVLEMNMSLMGKPISGAQLSNGDVVIVREKSSMCVFGPNGKDKRVIKENMSKPCCIAVGADGNFMILDYDMKTVLIFCGKAYTKLGQVRVSYKSGSKWDKLAVNNEGHFFICAHKENCIYEFNTKGKRVAQYGRGGNHGAGELYWPRGLSVDNEGNLFVADSGNDCLQLMTTQGFWVNLRTPEGCKLKCPTDVAVTDDGNLCVLESTGTIKILQYAP